MDVQQVLHLMEEKNIHHLRQVETQVMVQSKMDLLLHLSIRTS